MANGNSITITGNTTRDPELRFTPSGAAVCTVGLAYSRRWQNKTSQEWEEEVSFYDVVCWLDLANNVAETVTKGMRITVDGRLDQRSWEKDGVKHYKHEIVADEVGVSLRYATASVSKNEKGEGGGQSKPKSRAADPMEEPF